MIASHLLPPFDRVAELLEAGQTDEAVLYYIQETGFVQPSEPELAPIDPGPECLVWLDRNVPWGVAPRPLADRLLRLVREGRLAVEAGSFVPNNPAVLRGQTAFLTSPEAVCLWGSPPAVQQPAEGYQTAHRFCGSLRLGTPARP